MIAILSLIIAVIFLALSIIHYYWAFGGKWALNSALPTNKLGKKMLNPSVLMTVIVGVILSLFSIYYLQKGNIAQINLPKKISSYLGYGIPVLFLIRAIGDFTYIGIFKKIKNTKFAKLDTKYYSPLCLVISILGTIVEIIK